MSRKRRKQDQGHELPTPAKSITTTPTGGSAPPPVQDEPELHEEEEENGDPPPAQVEVNNAYAEEMQKCQAKADFEKGTWLKFVFFCIQQPILLLFFSGCIVSRITSCYQDNATRQREKEQKIEVEQREREQHGELRRKIAVELSNRIERAEDASNAVGARDIINGNDGELIYPEFKKRSCASLLVELASLHAGKGDELKRIARDWGMLPSGDKVQLAEVRKIADRIRQAIQPLL